MGKTQIRLDKDVAEMVVDSSKLNSRTPPAEVNHILRNYYLTRKAMAKNLAGKSGIDPMSKKTIEREINRQLGSPTPA